ncbi:E3 SUMO-protein ligase RanBP2 [Bienertia sinuspersici]
MRGCTCLGLQWLVQSSQSVTYKFIKILYNNLPTSNLSRLWLMLLKKLELMPFLMGALAKDDQV